MSMVKEVFPWAAVRPWVRRFKHRCDAAIVARDTLDALRSVTNWGSGVGRGKGNARAAGRFNRACIEIDCVIHALESELWAVAELSDEEYAEWSRGA